MTELCKSCSRKSFCGNETTQDYCTGYQPTISISTGLGWNKDDLLAWGIWAKYEEPKYRFDKHFEKFIKKWLRMQKKNRRRWGG